MPDYRVVADSEVQPDAPVTSSLGFALRDNPAAIAEGALNAPKVRSEGLNLTGASGDRTSDGADIVVNIIDPKNPNKVMKFKHSDIIDATNKAGVSQIMKHLIPDSIYGTEYNNLEKATRVVQEFQ